MYKVYAWMFVALAISTVAAWYVSATPSLYIYIMNSPFILLGLMIAQLALVVVLSMFLLRMSFMTALGMFLLYAVLLGVMLSSIFVVFTQASIYITLFVTAGMFGSMALYGYFTRADLTSIGNLCIMVLIGLIIGLIVNIFFKSQMFDLILSGVGVVIFTLLTAYDVQKIKRIGQQIADQGMKEKIALLGALTLYLDFINLFLFLLRFTGRRQQ
jgi:FtsH-binding integral membrane protein